MATLKLRPGVEVFTASDGDVYLLGGAASGDVVLREASPAVHRLVRELEDGSRTLDELAAGLASTGLTREHEVRDAVAELQEAGVVHRCPTDAGQALDAVDAERYDRQLHYFADQAAGEQSAAGMQAALGRATVVVLGAGGLGSWAGSGLACAGVGRIVLVDDDTVELSNLNRQILYRTSDLGRPKVEAAAEALGGLNPRIEVVTSRARVGSAHDVRAVARDADFVVCTADSPPHAIGRWVNEACLELGTPHLSAGQFPPMVRVGPTFVPGRGACLECQERAIRRDFGLYDELVEQRRRHAPVAATLGAPSGLIGSLIAMEVIHWITGICEPATLGRGLLFDLRDFSTSWQEVPPDPSCPACGGGSQEAGAGAGASQSPKRSRQ
jgi:bacteriocin biosynthesis cyclodehydratase domain-containing protein